MARIFENPDSIYLIHNAKFDLKKLRLEGIDILSRVHCTQLTARVLENNHFQYTLDACAKRIGFEKDTAVEEYVKEHKLYETFEIPGKKQKKTRKFFDRVPLSIISKYAEHDAQLHLALGTHQFLKLKEEFDPKDQRPSLKAVYENEHKLLRVCIAMEEIGVKIDRNYVRAALEHEQTEVIAACDQFLDLTGTEFTDSNKALETVFKKVGAPIGKTAKGNPSFTADNLEKIDSPIARLVTRIRKHSLYAGTYYSSFLNLADDGDVIHPDMRQDGTDTGRFSYSNPNLQNVPKEDDSDLAFYVRKSFVPRPGFCFVAIDYSQQEFRMFLDYAGETKLISEIMNGKDVHQATADEIGVSRHDAKTINFGLLYGMGTGMLAARLKISVAEARQKRNRYFSRLPRVESLIRLVAQVGKHRGYIWNWAGRRYRISSPEYAYVLVNHLIQGGCSDVIKFAMVEIFDFLKPYKSRMVCQVHDELLFEFHEKELHLIEPVKAIMENIYKPRNGMKLTCSVDHSWISWGQTDKVKGSPYEGGNTIQGAIRAAS
jgi:DNA polymerase-1